MHICEDHEELLPEGISPMLMPDTPDEAEVLLCCLEMDLYPTTVSASKSFATRVLDRASPEPKGKIQR